MRKGNGSTGTKVLDTSKMKIAQTGENNGSAKLKENEVKEIIYLLKLPTLKMGFAP